MRCPIARTPTRTPRLPARLCWIAGAASTGLSGLSGSATAQTFTELEWRSEVVPNLDLGAGRYTDLQVRGRLVTATGAGSPGVNAGSPTVPGTTPFGLNTEGVARLFLDSNPVAGLGSICTASLLSTGQHLLTAAHCVTDANGLLSILDGGDGNAATFQLPGGNQTVSFGAADITVHPNWNGGETNGFDVAIIDLGAPLSQDIPRYDVFAGNNGEEFARPMVKVGFGTSGDGSTGVTIGAGTKRVGLNQYESLGFGFLDFENPDTQLMFDFDGGDPANDAFGRFFGADGVAIQNPIFDDAVGFGTEEVGSAPGDSGGPSFLFNEAEQAFQIAGVTSFGLSFALDPDGDGPLGPVSPDATVGLDSSFGEFAGDTRVAQADIAAFIQATIPEPASLTMIGLGGLSVLRRGRRGV